MPEEGAWLLFRAPSGDLWVAHQREREKLLAQGYEVVGTAELDHAFAKKGHGSALDAFAIREGARIIYTPPSQRWRKP
jgi:hypothetical protein